MIVRVALCLAVPALWLCVGCSQPSEPEAEEGQVEARLEAAAERAEEQQLAAERAQLAAEREQLALGKAAQKAVVAEGQAVRDGLARVTEAAARWEAQTDALLTGDEGKMLAASPDAVAQFQAVYASPERPAESDLDALRQQTDTLMEPAQAALDDPANGRRPSEELGAELRQLRQRVDGYAAVYDKHFRILDALLVNARNAGTPAAVTLQAAVDELDKQKGLEDAEVIAAAGQKGREEQRDQTIQAVQDRDKAIADAERRRIRDEEDRIKAQAQREALVARAESPEVQARLQPFIAPGRFPIHSKGFNSLHKTEQTAPVSYKALLASGALDPTPEGRKRLLGLANHRNNDRPDWNTKDPETDLVQQAQRDLIELGAIMAEPPPEGLGLLAP